MEMERRDYLKSGRFWFLGCLTLAVITYQVLLTYSTVTLGRKRHMLGFESRAVVGRNTVILVRPTDREGNPTPAARAGIATGDRILAVQFPGDREPHRIVGLFDFTDALRKSEPGVPVTLTVERPNGRPAPGNLTLTLELPSAPPWYVGLPIRSLVSQVCLPLLCIAAALFIGLMRLKDPGAFLASLLLFCFTGASWAGGYGLFPQGLRVAALVLYVTLFSFWSYLFMRFFFLFPNPSSLEARAPWLKRALAAFPVGFAAWNVNWAYTEAVSFERMRRLSDALGFVDVVLDLFFIALFAVGFFVLVSSVLTSSSRTDRRRLVLILAGSLGILPTLASYFMRAVLGFPTVPPWLFYAAGLGLGLFPLFFAYAVIKHRVFGIRLILRRGLQFALLSKGFLFAEGTLVFLALYFGLGPFLAEMLHWTHPGILALFTALLTMLAVLVVRRVNRRFLRVVERRFFREAYDARIVLVELSRALRQLATEPFDLLRLVTSKVVDSLHPQTVSVFVRGSEALRFPPPPGEADSLARNLGAADGAGFLCLCWRKADSPGRFGSCTPSPPVVLSGESCTAKALEALSTEEPSALGMDLSDPRCWTADLRRAHSNDLEAQAELAILEKLGPRLLVPLSANRRLIGFMALGEKQSEEPYSAEDRELLLTVAQQVALALDYGEFIREEEAQISLRRDLEIAKTVQEKLFPQDLPTVKGLDYAGTCRPARGVGGDYYDFLDLGEGRLGIALGDVAGKGISAALLMASLQAMLRIHVDAHKDELEKLTADINRHMCRAMDCSRFASFFIGVFDSPSRVLRYVNAGHNPPFLLKSATGAGRDLGAQAARNPSLEEIAPRVHRLMPTGMVLGVDPEARYRQGRVELDRGDLLVVFTDGVTEARSPREEEYGEERLQDLLLTNAWRPAGDLLGLVLEDVERFSGAAPQSDDVTLIVARATS